MVSRKNKFTNNYDKKIINRYPNIKITKIICDLSKEQKKILISKLKNKKINILINNATFNENNLVGYASTFEKQSIKNGNHHRSKLDSSFHLCQGLRKNLINSGNGSTSMFHQFMECIHLIGKFIREQMKFTVSAKGGIIQLTKWLSTAFALELG